MYTINALVFEKHFGNNKIEFDATKTLGALKCIPIYRIIEFTQQCLIQSTSDYFLKEKKIKQIDLPFFFTLVSHLPLWNKGYYILFSLDTLEN